LLGIHSIPAMATDRASLVNWAAPVQTTTLPANIYIKRESIYYSRSELYQNKVIFEFIEFLRDQFLKTVGPPNEVVFVLVFRN
jgi:hypothetical protein